MLGNLSVEGLGRTQEAVVSRELSGLKDASSLEELKDVLLDATDNLKQLDIFDVVEVRMNAGEQREGQVWPLPCRPCRTPAPCDSCAAAILLLVRTSDVGGTDTAIAVLRRTPPTSA